MNKIIYSFFILLALVSCTDSKENTAQVKRILNVRPERKEEPKDSVTYAHLHAEVKNYMRKLDAAYNRSPYYFKFKDQLFFYVCKGNWDELKSRKFQEGGRLGIVNQNFEVLLPVEYTKLYNPDATADGYIEIEKTGKKGLYNYLTGKVIEPQFDIIFPSHLSDYIAFGKTGNNYFSITDAGIEAYSGEIPTYNDQKWEFNIHSDKLSLLYDSYVEHYDEGDMQEPRGIIVVPSYLYQLDILPEIVEYINTSENEYGVSATKEQIVQSESFSDKLTALFVSFYEEGVDGRGWQIEEKNLVVVDDKNNVISKEKILESPDYSGLAFCGEEMNGYRYLTNGLVEIHQVVYQDQAAGLPYSSMTIYSYFQIDEAGRILPLNSNRFFDFTKYVELTEDHFKGCFSSKETEPKTIDGVEGNMWLTDHLSVEDLDLMRNEIYAEYGLIFKTEKWKNYFGSKSWYKPQYDNVDHLLSDIDKKNLEFIKTLQEKMKPNEERYTNKRWLMYYAAG